MTKLTGLTSRVVNKLKNRSPLKGVGRGSINLIDVGSSGPMPWPWGEHTAEIGNLLLFDPLEAGIKRGHNDNITVCDSALWDSEGERDFYIFGYHGSGSSLLAQNIEYVTENFETLRKRGPRELADTWFQRSELKNTYKVRCETLDSVLANLGALFPYHVLKIDAQGCESRILGKAQKYLQRDCIALHMELFTVPLYKDMRLLPEVSDQVAELGFDLALKFPAHGSFDSQHDCLFLKRGVETAEMSLIRSLYGVKTAVGA